jgi:arylsulfatase A-like enzyme
MMGEYPSDWHHQKAFFGLNRSLPEILTGLGYQTLAIQSVPYIDPLLVHGFQEVDNSIGGIDENWDLTTGMKVSQLALDRALGDKGLQKPFFLWVHYFDPHAYYLLNKQLIPWLGDADDLNSYKHEVHYTDRAINVLLGNLQQAGQLDNTIIVFTSDHGEEFGEHGIHGHLKHTYDTILRVPLFIKVPGLGVGRHQARVSALDLFPTLIDALGIQGTHPRPGRSLLPLMRGEVDTTGPVFAEVNLPAYHFQTLYFDQWKFIHDLKTQSLYLFDVGSDPGESRNLVSDQTEAYQKGRDLLDRWHDQHFNSVRIKDRLSYAKERGLLLPRTSAGVLPDCFNLSPRFSRCR